MSVRLYIGNLPKELERQELAALFEEYGDSVSTKVITDRKTGKCRGFGFVTVKTDEEADKIIEKYNGYTLKESTLKIEKANPRTKGEGEEGSEVSAPAPSGGGRRKNNSGGGGNKPKRTSSGDSDSVQPDPRWAQELEKLKELLAAQTTNS
ncbi:MULTISPECIES: RNA-binding protein [unclassified Leptolyngbya]|uniref:RNA recognition motif domain-containing protein n=1 Tax=unclassified Leptolyngbya TaxID=2650499 RepID=UPI001686B7A0|nr:MULTISPECIES: RNA-binding protein [unclassified Leptolyngbya]MBD1912120.1 RNA-binding protein [Leptolyngbya sp. FACHB-8]MBD2155011.1 RNA-binding protein [Leptolyngbya sp. FACHB-16]